MNNHFNEAEYNMLIEKYNYKEMLHETFKNVIVPEFKKRGFKKKGKTFYRERNELIETCNVQYSSFNHRTTASFTYNIAIAIPSLYDSIGIEYTDKLKATICDLRFGEIVLWANGVSSHGDYWYSLEAYTQSTSYENMDEEDILEAKKINSIFDSLDIRYNMKTGDGFADVVVEDINNFIIKFFESIPGVNQLLEHINNDDPNGVIDESIMYHVANLYYFHGEQEKGRQILKRIRNGVYSEAINNDIEDGQIFL